MNMRLNLKRYSVDEFINFENDQQTSEFLSDEEIIAIVKNTLEDDNQGEREDHQIEIDRPKITNK